MTETYAPLLRDDRSYLKNFPDCSVGLLRDKNGTVVLVLATGDKADIRPDGTRCGTITTRTYEFTSDEWREVERALQIAK